MRVVLAFCARFLVVAPLCLLAWWALLPAYAWCLGQLTRLVLYPVLDAPIDEVLVERHGILSTGSLLRFVRAGATRSIPVGQLVSNVAPFAALVLATPGMAWRRRAVTLGIGSVLLALGHATYLPLVFVFAPTIAASPAIPTALGQVFITLPFLLWILLVYWERIGHEAEASACEEEEREKGTHE